MRTGAQVPLSVKEPALTLGGDLWGTGTASQPPGEAPMCVLVGSGEVLHSGPHASPGSHRTGDVMTTETSAPSPAMTRTTATRSLWRIGDVASWLTLCENTARDICDNEADAPRPILTVGKIRIWHPAQWDAWARSRAGLDLQADQVGGVPASELWTGAVT